MLWGAIVLDTIVLGSNKKQKLSGGNYVKAIYLGSIIQGQFSRQQLFCGNCQVSVVLQGNSLGVNFLGGSYPGEIVLGTNCPGGNYPGDNCPVPAKNILIS